MFVIHVTAVRALAHVSIFSINNAEQAQQQLESSRETKGRVNILERKMQGVGRNAIHEPGWGAMEQDLALVETNYAVMKTREPGQGTGATAESEKHIERCLSDVRDDLFRKFHFSVEGGLCPWSRAEVYKKFIEEAHNARGSCITIPSLNENYQSKWMTQADSALGVPTTMTKIQAAVRLLADLNLAPSALRWWEKGWVSIIGKRTSRGFVSPWVSDCHALVERGTSVRRGSLFSKWPLHYCNSTCLPDRIFAVELHFPTDSR